MALVLKIVAALILFLVVAVLLAITIVPRFLDRIYYEGPASDHFDGARFFNPTNDAETFRLPAGGSRGGFLWRQLTGNDGRPKWPERVPVRQSVPEARIEGERMVVTWIGHATVLVQTHGLNILTDPVYAERAGPFGIGPRRVGEPGIAFDRLPKIDVVLVSHNHYDHLDLKTIKRLWDRDHPQIVTALGTDTLIRGAGAEASALDWGGTLPVADGVAVTAVRAHHWTSRWFTDRNRALWAGFVVRLPAGGNLYFAGDTGLGDGRWPAEAAALGPVRLALIPIGAFRFMPDQMTSGSHIGPAEAALIYQRLGAAHGVPIHWGTFRLSFEGYDTPPRLLAAAMRCLGARGFDAAAIGVPQEIAPVGGSTSDTRPITAADRDALLRCMDTPETRALQ